MMRFLIVVYIFKYYYYFIVNVIMIVNVMYQYDNKVIGIFLLGVFIMIFKVISGLFGGVVDLEERVEQKEDDCLGKKRKSNVRENGRRKQRGEFNSQRVIICVR